MKNLFQQEESYFPEDITRGKYDSLGWNKYTEYLCNKLFDLHTILQNTSGSNIFLNNNS